MALTPNTLLRRQTGDSESYGDPLAEIQWAQFDLDTYWLPESIISLSGVPRFHELPEEIKRRLSHYECINVLECLAWLDAIFLRQMARWTCAKLSYEDARYSLHALREKAGRRLVLIKALADSGLTVSGAYRSSALSIETLTRCAPAGGALFWLGVTVVEDLGDRLVRHVRSAEEYVHPVVRQICDLHALMESQHMVFAFSRLDAALKKRGFVGRALITDMGNFLVPSVAERLFFPSSRVYKLAGLPRGVYWPGVARKNPSRISLLKQCIANTLRALKYYRVEREQ